MLSVVNNVLGESLRVTDHARARFAERSAGDLAERLKIAVPYGGQFGDDLLLADGDVVFATKKNGAIRRVVTCLTKQQAIANLPSLWHAPSVDFQTDSGIKREPAPSVPNGIAAKKDAAAILSLAERLPLLDDQAVSDLLANAIRVRQGLTGTQRGEVGAKLIRLLPALQEECGRRKRARKMSAHAAHCDLQQAAIYLALQLTQPPELVAEVLRKVAELRTIPRAEWPPKPPLQKCESMVDAESRSG